MTQTFHIMLIAFQTRYVGYEIEATWVQLGDILYLTIAGEAKGLAIAASDDLPGLVSFENAQGKMLKIQKCL